MNSCAVLKWSLLVFTMTVATDAESGMNYSAEGELPHLLNRPDAKIHKQSHSHEEGVLMETLKSQFMETINTLNTVISEMDAAYEVLKKDEEHIQRKYDGEIQMLIGEIQKLKSESKSYPAPEPDIARRMHSSGVNYVQWGKQHCSQHSAITVYSGQAAKASYDHTGGGTNFICLPKHPQWKKYHPGFQKYSIIYGAEYSQNDNRPILDNRALHGDTYCAVCESPRRQQVLMVPGRYTCPTGWNREYSGYLMAERSHHTSQSSYICVDEEYEVLGERGRDERMESGVSPVEVGCGVLDCGEYPQGRELTCVVCTK